MEEHRRQARGLRGFAGAHPGPRLPAASVCGALGRFDRDRVAAMAALLRDRLSEVHRDRRSVLWLDREPIRWAGPSERGLAWSESPRPAEADAAAWLEAAGELDACGLVLRGRRRLVHSSASGLAPVYWLADEGAVYFCSRIDPLVHTAKRRLRPDWTAWAAILRLGYAIGTRTPFDEIRRLEHSSTIEHGPAGPVVAVGRWRWAEEPQVGREEAIENAAHALASELEAVAQRDVVVGLSGGADSRLALAALLAGRNGGADLRAFTLPGTWGRDDDERLARRAATAAGVPHAVLPLEREGYWPDAEAFAAVTEYQQALEWAWFAPLVRRFGKERTAVAVDGLAGDILVHGKFAGGEELKAADPVALSRLLWRRLQRGRNPRGLLRRPAERAITAAAREQLDSVARRLHGHPAAFTLAFYRTRTTRGMSAGVAALGEALPTSAPFATDAVARAALRCPPEAKLEGAFHQALIARLAPALAAVPVNSYGFAPPPPSLPERRRVEPALEGFRDLLRESPFRPWFRGALRDAVEDGPALALEEFGRERVVNGFALHALWLRRYGDRLRGTSPRNLLG